MEKFWTAALKATGPVAIVGLVLWTVVQQLFQENMLSLFETEQRFTITITIVSGLLICLVAAIRSRGISGKDKKPESVGESRSAELNNSTVNGDIVLGDKIDNRGKK